MSDTRDDDITVEWGERVRYDRDGRRWLWDEQLRIWRLDPGRD